MFGCVACSQPHRCVGNEAVFGYTTCCGNGKCDGGETYKNCAVDCPRPTKKKPSSSPSGSFSHAISLWGDPHYSLANNQGKVLNFDCNTPGWQTLALSASVKIQVFHRPWYLRASVSVATELRIVIYNNLTLLYNYDSWPLGFFDAGLATIRAYDGDCTPGFRCLFVDVVCGKKKIKKKNYPMQQTNANTNKQIKKMYPIKPSVLRDVESNLLKPLQPDEKFAELARALFSSSSGSDTATKHQPQDNMIARAARQLRKSNFSKAANILGQSSRANLDSATIASLQCLYPHESQADQRLENLTKAQLVTEDDLILELSKMAKYHRTPGFSKVTPQGLLLVVKHFPAIRQTLVLFINSLFEGSVPTNCFPNLRVALGVPLNKNPGIRPIAINECVMNLASRLMLKQCGPKISSALTPFDLGFGVSGGCPAVVHALNALWAASEVSNSSLCIVQVDFQNAFNSIFRSKVLETVSKHCPEALEFLKWRYQDLKVVFKSDGELFSIDSERGVSQGDSLSGPLFQLTMAELLAPIRSKFQGKGLIVSYHDDVSLMFSCPQDALEAFQQVELNGTIFGLKVNLEKSQFLSTQVHNLQEFPLLLQMQRSDSSGTKALGGFVGCFGKVAFSKLTGSSCNHIVLGLVFCCCVGT
jgi:hypothetical protein